jgi:hypothetical protein
VKQAELVKRIENLERALQDLRQSVEGNTSSPKGDWRNFIGMFHNDPYFEKAMKAGAAYRNSLRPKGKPRKGRPT